MTHKNEIHCGDNLEVMKGMDDESVDLIYLDPPFFSGRNYEVIWGDGFEERSFKDTEWYRVECPKCSREVVKAERFCPICGSNLENAKVTRSNDIYAYIDWMIPRLTEMHRILKPTGSIYLHVDWHAVHYLKIEMDRIFGMNNFQNEIVWCYHGGGLAKRSFKKKHDTILLYSKTKNYTFNPQYKNRLIEKNYKKGVPIKNPPVMEDWWADVPSRGTATQSKEWLGYPTQKPEALLDRIIKASSNEGDIVFDPFCGCGTSLSVAKKLNRQYIGIDISYTACIVIKDRIKYPDLIKGMPHTTKQLTDMSPHEFQNIVCDKLDARNTSPNPSKPSGADGNVDGWVNSNLITGKYGGSPIQVKRSPHVGVATIKEFESTMMHKNKKIGFVVALSFGKGAINQVKKSENLGLTIHLIEAKDLMDFDFKNL